MGKSLFINRRFKKILPGRLLTVLLPFVVQLTVVFAAGRFWGERGLAALGFVMPLYFFAMFVSALIGIGTTVLCFEGNRQIFGRSALAAVLLGILSLIILMLLENPYYIFMELPKEVMGEIEQLYHYEAVLCMIMPIQQLTYLLVIIDNDTRNGIISEAVEIAVTLLTIGPACKKLGMEGPAVGALLGKTFSMGVLIMHFFKKSNTLKLTFGFSLKDLWYMLKIGFSNSIEYLCRFIAVFILNIVMVKCAGPEYLALSAIVSLVLGFSVFFDGVGTSLIIVTESYVNEMNFESEGKAAECALTLSVVAGAVLFIFFELFAGFIPGILKIESLLHAKDAVLAVRLASPVFIFSSLTVIMLYQYRIVNKGDFLNRFFILKSVLFPVLLGTVLGILWGNPVLFCSFAIGEMLSLIILVIYTAKHFGCENFPLVREKMPFDFYSFDILLTKENIVLLRNRVEKVLAENDTDSKTVKKIMFLVEESAMVIMDKNKRKVAFECTLMFDEVSVRVMLRDDGEIFNLTDTDSQISEFAEYILYRFFDSIQRKSHLFTEDFNRNYFMFKR